MQGVNSIFQDLQNNHHQIQPQTPTAGNGNGHFSHPTTHDDFLDQMLSTLPSSSWSPWDSLKSDEPPIDGGAGGNSSPYIDESTLLASKLRQHQISGGTEKMMMQQMMMARAMAAAAGGGGGDIDGCGMMLGSNGSLDDGVDGSPFKSPQGGGDGGQSLFNGFGAGNGQTPNQAQHFHHQQNFGAASGTAAMSQQPQVSGGSTGGGAPKQPRQRVRARRGQATDPHSIAERLRRERIAERMKGLQELVPNSNKTDKASMLDEIIDYVKFLQLQVKVLSMSRLGGAGAVAPLVADMSSEGGADCVRTNGGSRSNGNNQTAGGSTNDSNLTMTEHQVAKLMEEDMGSAMQYLQGKGLCLMPISLATAISTATCHNRTPLINPLVQSNGGGGEGPSSPSSLSVLTVQSATMGNGVAIDGPVKDTASVSKP
jgi:hypothetical protein